MNSLTWNDLFVDAAQLDFPALLLEWPGLVTGPIRPIGASVFGDLFVECRGGEVVKLDVLEGGLEQLAASGQQFADLMNSVEWQEHHLLRCSRRRGWCAAPASFSGLRRIRP